MRRPSRDAQVGSDDLYGGECGARLQTNPRKDGRSRTPLIIGIVAVVVAGCGVVPPVPQLSPTPDQSLSPGASPTAATAPTPRPPSVAPGPDAHEPDDSIQEAQPIATNGLPQAHNLHVQGDHDYVHFEAFEGTAYTIETSQLGGDVDSIIYLYDSEGNELTYADDGADEPLASRIAWIAPSSGTYYVMIRDLGEESAGPDATYEIRIIASDTVEGADSYEPDDSIAQASPIDTDGTYQSHTFHVTVDVDYVSFLSQEGVEYSIETGNLEGDCDTVIYLYDEDGTELDYDDDSGEENLASRLVWIAPDSGIYYVAVEDFYNRAGPEVSYQIWISP
ncbi:MAG: hypothetical protein GTO63_14165 [Anaerolineae bacterium]|nr:hypothetical protein [Anaerolineae bacterium]NIN95991.1 hypothetical protein [Anaerolineae bacterium]NIQ79023.1 hypothetical protein [Anaerolineae bacterium]